MCGMMSTASLQNFCKFDSITLTILEIVVYISGLENNVNVDYFSQIRPLTVEERAYK